MSLPQLESVWPYDSQEDTIVDISELDNMKGPKCGLFTVTDCERFIRYPIFKKSHIFFPGLNVETF